MRGVCVPCKFDRAYLKFAISCRVTKIFILLLVLALGLKLNQQISNFQ